MSLTPAQNDAKIAEIMRLIDAQESIIRREQYTANSIYAGEDETYAATVKIMAAQKEIERLNESAAPLHAAYDEARWSRFYLVQNGNGHVHKDTSCSTCFPTTQYGWLPDCSGMTEAEIVTEFGEKVCTVCFPSAPANPQHRAPGRRDKAALAAKAAEKDAKTAAKLAKAVLPDGSALKLNDPYDRPATLIAAQRCLSSKLSSIRFYGENEDKLQDVETLVGAIAAKTGRTYDEVLDEANAKADKKYAKDLKESEAHAKRMGWV